MVELTKDLIEVWLSQQVFEQGECRIDGAVCIQTSAHYDTIKLQLIGTNSVTYWQKHVKRNKRYLKRNKIVNEIVNVDQVLLKTVDAIKSTSPSAYKFQIEIPSAKFPPSTFCISNKRKGLEGQVKYILQATLMRDGYVLSSSKDTEVIIARKLTPEQPITMNLEGHAGGCWLIKPTPWKAGFILQKTVFHVGESIKISAFCDN